jgi:hypothetical protein
MEAQGHPSSDMAHAAAMHVTSYRSICGLDRQELGVGLRASREAGTDLSFCDLSLSAVWYGMVPFLTPGPQSLRPGGGSWIGRRLSTLRLSPFRPRLFGDRFRFHRDRRQR